MKKSNNSEKEIIESRNYQRTSRTPRARRRKMEMFVLKTSEEIDQMTAILANLSRENAEKRTNISTLEFQLETITKAINQNIDIVQDVNNQIEAENDEIADACQQQQELLQEIAEKYRLCIERGVDFSHYPEFEIEELQDFLPEVEYDDSLILVRHIAGTIPYFSECDSVESFLKRCSELMREVKSVTNVKRFRSTPSKFRPDEKLMNLSLPQLKEKLRKMEKKYSFKHAQYSKKLADLNQQKTELEEIYLNYIQESNIKNESSIISNRNDDKNDNNEENENEQKEKEENEYFSSEVENTEFHTPKKKKPSRSPSPILFKRVSPVHSLIPL
ncbi:hypothetical protein TRFO_19893 [Tritrichomonas foetus]|uniref:Uncharacterized protein n=1 Tax=Tritrichomonas foetus TaxID=1144522 RepID=A0A1J4KM38_9EUKA|nr:hypothetical protein TRFO_19893 [Tritrichomonas foetus]|eukprot:OHT10758.1 hypothetical protein TRFO_19893 [Tritrichomonas foetus]